MAIRANTGVTALNTVIPDMLAELRGRPGMESAEVAFVGELDGTNVIRASFDLGDSRLTEDELDMPCVKGRLTGIMLRVFGGDRYFAPYFRAMTLIDGRVYRIEVNFVYNDYPGSPQYVGPDGVDNRRGLAMGARFC